jgi:hypothetical protein
MQDMEAVENCWINTLLGIHSATVEKVNNSAVFCQIIETFITRKIKLDKMNYSAITNSDMVANDMILQETMNSENISRNILIESLTNEKCMTALEMF